MNESCNCLLVNNQTQIFDRGLKKWNFTQQTNKMEGKCNGSIGFYDNDDDDDEDQCAVVWQRRDIVNCSPKDYNNNKLFEITPKKRFLLEPEKTNFKSLKFQKLESHV